MRNKNILIISAHCDDEILGCGGTIAKLGSNNSISALILVDAVTSRAIKPSISEIEKAKENAIQAQKVIGINNSYFENFPDNRLDDIVLLEIVKKIEGYIAKIKPDIIFTHHHSDLNIDHRLTFEAVITSCRPQPDFNHPDIYCFEIPSSTDWQIYTGKTMFKPNVFIDISDTINIKLEALEIYKAEMREYPHSRSLKGIKIMAQDWGRKVGKTYVEAFELIRSIRNDL